MEVVDRSGPSDPLVKSALFSRKRLYIAILCAGVAVSVALFWYLKAAASIGQAGLEHPSAAKVNRVVALGRLTPNGELRTLAAPFGSGDARVAEILVKEGQQVAAGTPLAIFDSAQSLEAARAVAQKQLAGRRAALAQIERSVASNQAESTAALARAKVAAKAADVEYQRWTLLAEKGFVSQTMVDQRKAQRDEAYLELQRVRASVERHAGQGMDQPDVSVAHRAVDSALAELERATKDLDRAVLRTPSEGTVLTIHTRPGERPGNAGVIDFGDTRTMTAEVELYQSDVAYVRVGQRAKLNSPALAAPLTGLVSRVGSSVGRQRLTDTSPGANLDARVVLATVTLDDASSSRSRHLVGLEVKAEIETDTP